ncbi:unnamed protein product [Caenorhabditis bovis]|uniref:RING-type domain-containing protein n=1 Tax=Caenorhabditis bovis TaxID=2654633 RepID=A0A8S1FBH8_9PELO|nr:unnamed protein product [Caenorhabditis bovis]
MHDVEACESNGPTATESSNLKIAGELNNDKTKNNNKGPEDALNRLVPPILEDFKMIAKTAELRVAYDAPTNQTTYTYTLCWEDDVKRRDDYRIKSASMLSEFDVHPVMAVCDGPCRKAFPSNKLNTIGRCGHYLCEACYGIVTNSDGTKGCSSFACNWQGQSKTDAMKAYETEICRKQRQRANDMQKRGLDVKPASVYSNTNIHTSNSKRTFLKTDRSTGYDVLTETDFSTSQESKSVTIIEENDSEQGTRNMDIVYPGHTEMIIAKLIVIEKNQYNAVLRIHTRMEVATSMGIMKAITLMLLDKKKSPRQYLNSGVPYYVEPQKDGTKKLKRIKNKEFETFHLYDFPQIHDHVYFVLDTIGYVNNGGPVQISLNYDD